MPVLTDLASAQVKRGVKTLYGTVMSTPALLVSDGLNNVYACDVNIGPTDPTGRINQYNQQRRNGEIILRNGYTNPESLTRLPGQRGWELSDSLTVNTVLHNVVIARNNVDLIYAAIGTPVILSRSHSGQWEITGFAVEQPGTYTMVPVNLGDMTIGAVVDMSLEARLLSLGEVGTLAPFGEIPLGASGIFSGGYLVRITV